MTRISANPAPCGELEKRSADEERATAGSGAGRKPARSSRAPLTATERQQVREMALIDGLTNSEIGRRMGHDRGTIANVLKDADTAALREQLMSAQREQALQTLRSNTARMAGNWVNAADVAAGKGDHRPSRDLLLHTGVIQPVVADQGPRIAVQINLHGGPEPESLVMLSARGSADAGSGPFDSPIMPITAIGTEGHAAAGPPAFASEGGGGPRPKERTHTPSLPRPIGSRNFSDTKCLPSATDPDQGNS